MVLRFVGVRSILPGVRRAGVDVSHSHDDDFPRSHAGGQLQVDHSGQLAAQERLDGFDVLQVHGFDGR